MDLKLNKLSKSVLNNREMKETKGGRCCTCSCAYEGQPGGSSTSNNRQANYGLGDEGGYSTTGDNAHKLEVIIG